MQMTPKKVTFKVWPPEFGRRRQQLVLVDWLAHYYGCLYGRGGGHTTWNFKRLNKQGTMA
jgi:hypothetical protein